MALTLSAAARNAAADGVVDLVDGASPTAGKLEIQASDDSVLVTFTLADPAFGAASTGVATALGVPITATAGATGTASKARIRDGADTDIITGLTVGTSGTNVVLSSTSIVSGQDYDLTSGLITMPATA